MQNHAIVITGAPASGKTTCLRILKADPRFSNFVFLEELARQLLEENPEYRYHTDDFHREIYRLQIQREDEIKNKPFITDRGTLDGFTFCPDLIGAVGTSIRAEYLRYTAVIQLGSAASLGDEYYKNDNVRTESLERVKELEFTTMRIWENHSNFWLIHAEKDFEKKLKNLNSLLDYLLSR